MTQKMSLKNGVCDEHKFVISACGFTFQGYCSILNKYGIHASKFTLTEMRHPNRMLKISLKIRMPISWCSSGKVSSISWKA